MTPTLERSLLQISPEIFRSRGQGFQFEHGDGWSGVVRALVAVIPGLAETDETPLPVVAQCKEKFGTLRFYIDGAADQVEGAIEAAEVFSAHVCEVTGAPGFLHRRGDRIRTLSISQAARDGYEPLPPQAPEEGRAPAEPSATGKSRRDHTLRMGKISEASAAFSAVWTPEEALLDSYVPRGWIPIAHAAMLQTLPPHYVGEATPEMVWGPVRIGVGGGTLVALGAQDLPERAKGAWRWAGQVARLTDPRTGDVKIG